MDAVDVDGRAVLGLAADADMVGAEVFPVVQFWGAVVGDFHEGLAIEFELVVVAVADCDLDVMARALAGVFTGAGRAHLLGGQRIFPAAGVGVNDEAVVVHLHAAEALGGGEQDLEIGHAVLREVVGQFHFVVGADFHRDGEGGKLAVAAVGGDELAVGEAPSAAVGAA